MKSRFAALALLASVVVLLSVAPADAQFRRARTNVTVNAGGPAQVQAQVQQPRGLFNRGNNVNVSVNTGVGFQNVTHVQSRVAFRDSHAVNLQLIQRQQFRGQLDQLNTYAYAHNSAATLRLAVSSSYAVPQQVRQVQYVAQLPAPVVTQEYVQPAPVVGPPAPCPDPQYSTAPQPAPQRVVERVVVVREPVAVTDRVYYVRSAPVVRRQFVQAGCY